MATFDYAGLQATATEIIEKFGDTVTIAHLDGNQSRGTIAMPTHLSVDASVPEVGTVSTTGTTGYITEVRNAVCVGDKLTAYGKTWRVRESTQYKGPDLGLAYKVLLDS